MFLATIGIVAHQANGFPAAGTFISSQCVWGVYNGSSGGPQGGNFDYEVTRANGSGGTYATIECDNCNGCYHYSGLTYYSNSMDISFPGPYGDVIVGTSNYGEYADGNGGTYTASSNSYNVGCGGTYASQWGTDGATGWPMTTEWKIDCANDTYYTESMLTAGYVMAEYCSDINANDAMGTQWQMVPVWTQQVTDGAGGYIYSNSDGSSHNCGSLPNGYVINYSLTGSDPYIYYQQGSSGTYDYYYYAYNWSADYADGSGGMYSGSGTTNYQEAGYVFYTYYDPISANWVFYNFDGVSGYYETTG